MDFSVSPSMSEQLTPFLSFDRQRWAELRKSVPLTLTEQDLKPLLGINEELSLDEVRTIYLPLVRLINYYIDENIRRQNVLRRFLGEKSTNVPYIISIAGSVAVGKSTSARILQSLLSHWPQQRKVDLITTDGFLHPLAYLQEHNLLHIPNRFDIVNQPDILILEGLNVLQPNRNQSNELFVSDFVDFSIYVDAEEDLLKEWYIHRFLKFRQSAFTDPNSYFKHYANLSEQEAVTTAGKIWDEINGLNLKENILPTRERADLILKKGANHEVELVTLRK